MMTGDSRGRQGPVGAGRGWRRTAGKQREMVGMAGEGKGGRGTGGVGAFRLYFDVFSALVLTFL